MRTLVLVIAAVIAAAALGVSGVPALVPVAAPAGASVGALASNNTTLPPAKLYITVLGETVGGKPQFDPQAILVPELPIVLNVTFKNNESLGSGVQHTFTIADSAGKAIINTNLTNPQNETSVEFTINSLTNITYKGTSFKPLDPGNGTIQYYCIPHQTLGMVGFINVAGAPSGAASPEKGVLIRAYWIGMIAIVAMLIWIGISYFVIKSSSPRFRDNREHVRKGLP